MSNTLERLAQWLHDPFNRSDVKKHDEIIEQIIVTRERSAERSQRLEHYPRFPLSAQVGNPRLRRREHYVVSHK